MRSMLNGALLVSVLVSVLVLAGCAGSPRAPTPSPGPTPSASTSAAPAQAPRGEPRPGAAATAPAAAPKVSPLLAEQRWLSQLFEGTPVRISAEADGTALLLSVPMAFSFEAESPRPKPALAAVLDKLGQSLKRQPGSRLKIGAPGPAARALAARQHLLARGVAAHRVEAASSTQGDGVLLRLSLAAAHSRLGEPGVPMSARQAPGH